MGRDETGILDRAPFTCRRMKGKSKHLYPAPTFRSGPISVISVVINNYAASSDAIRIEETLRLIESLRCQVSSLPLNDEAKTEVTSRLAALETEMSRDVPDTEIIAECKKSVRTILEHAAGGLLAHGGGNLGNSIAALLQMIQRLW